VVPALAGAAICMFGLTSGCVERGYYAEDSGPVPDEYVWDGYEDIGVVGDQYYYLGPGNIWVICEPYRVERFHGWERDHHDWHAHAIHNDHYRNAGRGHAPAGHQTGANHENNAPVTNERHDERRGNNNHPSNVRENRPPERPEAGGNNEHRDQRPAVRETHDNDHPEVRKGHEEDGGPHEGKERRDQ